MTYAEWCERHSVRHGHCPRDCEKPQPCEWDGEMVCGRCLVIDRRISVMIPCTPAICD